MKKGFLIVSTSWVDIVEVWKKTNDECVRTSTLLKEKCSETYVASFLDVSDSTECLENLG